MRKLTDSQVIEIFFDVGDAAYFREKYNVDIRTVKAIKLQESHKHITQNMENPGQIVKWGLSPDQVNEIYYSDESFATIAQKYNIHVETVRNIKRGNTRTFEEWF
jgi:hypothetical protein